MVWNSPSVVTSFGRSLSGSAEQQSRDELVRVLAERDVAVGIAEQTPESGLHQGRLLSRALPFRVDELRGVEPRLLLRLESNVRPGLMRVAGQQKPLGDAEA